MAKQEDTPRAYLFKGDDDYQKDRELDALVKSLISDDFADFDLERIDGDSATTDRVLAGLSIPPMGSERRVVLIRHAQKMSKEEQEKLITRLESIPKSGCLILVNPAVDRVAGKAPKGSEIIGDLSKAVRKMGTVRDFSGGTKAQKQGAARQFAASLVQDSGKKIDGQALSALVARAGFDFTVLQTEVDKLVAYAGDAERITTADVEAVTSETPEEKVFKMVDAIAAKNPAMAIRSLNELFESGDRPDAEAPRSLSSIARIFRLIWQMKMLQQAGIRDMSKAAVPKEIRQQLPSEPNLLDVLSRQSWQHDKLARQAAGFNRSELAVAKADRMLKGIEGGIEDPMAVMELLVIELASGDRGLPGARSR
jgi:DNA polymerase-3 subunit delta